MGIFDGVFNTGPQQDAARAQVQGIQTGYNDLSSLFSQARGTLGDTYGQGRDALTSTAGAGRDALTSNYYAGISPFLSNFSTAKQGSNVLADALGLNGPEGNARAVASFKSNPSYQFGLDQGENAIAAQAQKGGMGASGNALTAAGQFATNYANQGWGDYLKNLMPYLNLLTPSAGGIQSGFTGLGSGLNTNLTNLGGNLNTNLTDLGKTTAGVDVTQGNAAYGANSSIGNAYANANLAQAGANANTLGAIGQGAKAIFSMLG